MVKATKGVYIKTETSVKEVILKIGEIEDFVIKDIDDTHLFIKEEGAHNLTERVEMIMESARNPSK